MKEKKIYEAPETEVVKLSTRAGLMTINASFTPTKNSSNTYGENVTIEDQDW